MGHFWPGLGIFLGLGPGFGLFQVHIWESGNIFGPILRVKAWVWANLGLFWGLGPGFGLFRAGVGESGPGFGAILEVGAWSLGLFWGFGPFMPISGVRPWI